MMRLNRILALALIVANPALAQDEAASPVEAIPPSDDPSGAIVAVQSLSAPVRVGPTLTIPDEINSAVLPYLVCRQSATGVPIRINGELEFRPTPDGNCSAVRDNAAKEALQLLRRSGDERPSVEQEAAIENVLLSIEEFSRPRTEQEILEAFENAEHQQ